MQRIDTDAPADPGFKCVRTCCFPRTCADCRKRSWNIIYLVNNLVPTLTVCAECYRGGTVGSPWLPQNSGNGYLMDLHRRKSETQQIVDRVAFLQY